MPVPVSSICTAIATTACSTGPARSAQLVERAKEQGMNALALTDHGNLHGALEFYKKAKRGRHQPDHRLRGVYRPRQPVREKDAGNSKEASYHLTLLAQNRTGFKNLIKLASAASLEGFYFKPRIDKELLGGPHEGIICLCGLRVERVQPALARRAAADRADLRRGERDRRAGSAACSASATSSRS